jgi:hypothetical protein
MQGLNEAEKAIDGVEKTNRCGKGSVEKTNWGGKKSNFIFYKKYSALSVAQSDNLLYNKSIFCYHDLIKEGENMPTPKKNKQTIDTIELEGELLNAVSYATYYNRMPLFTALRISNNGEALAEDIVVAVSGSTELILPQEITLAEVPAESTVEVSVENVLNPKYLSDIAEPTACTVHVKLTCGKITICELDAEVNALPIGWWSGLGGNVEILSSYVRPKLAD